MSTTLIPPTHYQVKQPGSPTRPLKSITEVASALSRCHPGPKMVLAVTGARQRRLNAVELRELAGALRALRPLSSGPSRQAFGVLPSDACVGVESRDHAPK
jgi:hypothetical protein